MVLLSVRADGFRVIWPTYSSFRADDEGCLHPSVPGSVIACPASARPSLRLPRSFRNGDESMVAGLITDFIPIGVGTVPNATIMLLYSNVDLTPLSWARQDASTLSPRFPARRSAQFLEMSTSRVPVWRKRPTEFLISSLNHDEMRGAATAAARKSLWHINRRHRVDAGRAVPVLRRRKSVRAIPHCPAKKVTCAPVRAAPMQWGERRI